MPPIEGAFIITNSSESVIIDPFTNSLEDDTPSLLLAPESGDILSNQEIMSSFGASRVADSPGSLSYRLIKF